MSGASQCEKFVRNAWKKELCSNCFKAKEEHPEKPKPVAQVHLKLPDAPKEGILKGSKKKSGAPKKSNKVIFPSKEFEVIGYGGDDVCSDDEDLPDFSARPAREEPDTDQDRALQKITKFNTEYNSVPANLQDDNEPIRLGKQLVDDKGKKKTLLVSVTPFGATSSIGPAKGRVQAKLLAAQATADVEPKVIEQTIASPKPDVEEAKAVEPITPIVAAPKVMEIGIKRSQPIDKNSKFRPNKECLEETKNANQVAETHEENRVSSENKLNDKLTTSNKVANLLDKAKKKVHNLPVIGDPNHYKFKTIDFNMNHKRFPVENNKTVVLDMYDLRSEVKLDKSTDHVAEITSPTQSPPKLLSSHVKITPTIVFETKKSEDGPALAQNKDAGETSPVCNVSSLHRSPKAALKVQVPPAQQSDEPVTNPTGSNVFDASIDTKTDSTPMNDCSTQENGRNERDAALCDKLANYEGIIGGEEVTVFSLEPDKAEITCEPASKQEPEESRPAPDGRADEVGSHRGLASEAHHEVDEAPCEQPPALPASPPPSMDPSFLPASPPPSVDSRTLPPSPPLSMDTRALPASPPPSAEPRALASPPSSVDTRTLPSSPPPSMDPRVSFLHQLTSGAKPKLGEKPKVPVKPVVIPSKKPHFRVFSPRPKSPSIETFLDATPQPPQHPPLAETLSDSAKKRPAPQPPSPRDDGPLRTARSSDNLLELSLRGHAASDAPAPAPRRSLSLSQDSLLDSGVSEMQGKKKSGRGRFSLRKLLHLGKHKEGGKEGGRREYRIEGCVATSPKPVIIHPLDLTGARLEVVPPHRNAKSRRSSSSASSSSGEHRESDIPSDSSASQSGSSSGNSGNDPHVSLERSRKPPPPPRSLSLEQNDKPARPPPPKSSPKRDAKPLPQPPADVIPPSPPRDNFYVNIGEARSGLAPNKPVRTGSLREIDIVKKLVPLAGAENGESKKQYWTGSLRGPPKCPAMGPPEDSGYESFDVSLTTTESSHASLAPEENLYECVQAPMHHSSPPDSGAVLRGARHYNFRPDRRSEGNIPEAGQDYVKFRFLRSVSVPYCGSEADTDIYSPYSFCGSEMGEEDYEWSPTSGRFHKVSRLKTKKGRSIVHKNLEDNYGAVIVANHEALTQVVEQMHQGPVAPPILRPLFSAHNLRWADFAVMKESGGVTVERRAFYPALWGLNPVTLCLAPEQSATSLQGKPPFSLHPLTDFHDLVPACFLPDSDAQDHTLVQCSVSVLSRLQIETLANYCYNVSNGQLTDELKKEVHFILLQTINALKTLQAAGIEEAPRGLLNMVVCREERDPHPRVCVLPGPVRDCVSLCACLLDLLQALPATELSPLLGTTLRAEKAVSLSQAKALLEFTLWGPADIAFGGGPRSSALQRWLDLERASVLHGLVRTRADLSVFEEWHLLFLVHTNAKVLADASALLETLAGDC